MLEEEYYLERKCDVPQTYFLLFFYVDGHEEENDQLMARQSLITS